MKTTSKHGILVRLANIDLSTSKAIGWLSQCAADSLAGKPVEATPDGMAWLADLRARVDSDADTQDASDGLNRKLDPAESEVWRLIGCLDELRDLLMKRVDLRLEQARRCAPGRPKKPRGLNSTVPKRKAKGKPGRKRTLDIKDDDVLDYLDRTSNSGKSQKARLVDLVRELVPDARRRTGQSPEALATNLAKRVAERRQAIRNQIGNAGNIESANPNERRGILDATASHPPQEDTCRDFPPLT